MRTVFSLLGKLALVAAAYLLLVAAGYGLVPDVKHLGRENPGKTAFMEKRETEWAAEGRKVALAQRWVPLSAISPYLIKAVLISEDDKFWQHDGFDFEAMQKAMEKNLEQGRLRAGGSTISQQLAKNLWLSPSKSPLRKSRTPCWLGAGKGPVQAAPRTWRST
jgi:monofunctional biosynthetic peptidoglycan transglycosylase